MDPKTKARIVRWSAWLVLATGLLLILSTAFFTAAPVGCVSCHDSEEYVAVPEGSPHESVDCTTCHIGPSPADRLLFGYYQALGMVVPIVSVTDGPAATVHDAACIECHDDLGTLTESAGLRINHGACTEGSTCVSCHSAVAHLESSTWPTSYNMEQCIDCHGVRRVQRSCDSCHTGKIETDVPTTGTFPVTHGPNWKQTHGMGKMSTCSACHTDELFCGECHGLGVPHPPQFASYHGPVALTPQAECLTCHNEVFCTACHVYEMPHPLAFTEEHGSIVNTDGDGQCGACHAPVDCITCHEKHVHPGGAGLQAPTRGSDR